MSLRNADRACLALIGMGLGLTIVALALAGAYRPPALNVIALVCGVFGTTQLALLLRRQSPRNLTPDFLGRCNGPVFQREGFCFTVSLDREDETATFTVMYQNCHSGPAVARIALRPVGSNLATVSPPIECGPAGFGVAKFPVPIPARHQGKKATIEVGASVNYPQGKGDLVHFWAGRAVRHDARFRYLPLENRALPGGRIACTLTHAAAKLRLTLPKNVAEEVSDDAAGHVEELWSLSLRYLPRQ